MESTTKKWLCLLSIGIGIGIGFGRAELPAQDSNSDEALRWSELPELPDSLGVAGPFAGVHKHALIVAGGANFPKPVWEHNKVWRDAVHVLVQQGSDLTWKSGGTLPRPIAYGASVSTPAGIVCMGGNDSSRTFDQVFRMSYDSDQGVIQLEDFPALPTPCAYTSAAIVGEVIYVAGGQRDANLDSAMNNFWSLDLSLSDQPSQLRWKVHDPMPGPPRALNLTIAHQRGDRGSIYVISGRRQRGDQVDFLKDVWRFDTTAESWQRVSDAPVSMMAGVAISEGNHLLVLGGADGTLFYQTDQLRDRHPGFPLKAWAYDVSRDDWKSAGPIPQNHVTTTAVRWNSSIIVPSGEIRPRVRSPKIWRVEPTGWD